jgi:hypothetical protein
MPQRAAEVRRSLDRYLIEVVERFGLCPWAARARATGELVVEIVWGTPTHADWLAAVDRAAVPHARVIMIVAPETTADPGELRAARDRVAAARAAFGVAEFHPAAPLDLATPPRLVPFLRRAPDPLLQLVPHSVLDAVRRAPQRIDRAEQLAMLGGYAADPTAPVAAEIAARNHATVIADPPAVAAILDDIAADRAQRYAAAGIRAAVSTSR